ncbi:MAG TPA: YceI family protein, partial [Chitinophagales bacterium]|nr:YceI family protein [Chitinophagales bacterium]
TDTTSYAQADLESLGFYKKEDRYVCRLSISLNGATRKTDVPFDFKQTGDEAEFRAGFTINRNNFGEGVKTFTGNEPARVNIYIKAKANKI